MDINQKTPTVLIVDDDVVQVDLFRISLERFGGFHVITATDGKKGLIHAIEDHPDCVIVDMMMPELNGLQLIRLLRGDPSTASIPLVVLSALTQAEDQLQGMLAGADCYMTKPVPLQDMVKVIQQIITRSQEEYLHQRQQLLERESA
jgi:DNA-binding response OmpR family regulator